eukprot:1917666-Prorocentrum_lima.AAC.1
MMSPQSFVGALESQSWCREFDAESASVDADPLTVPFSPPLSAGFAGCKGVQLVCSLPGTHCYPADAK